MEGVTGSDCCGSDSRSTESSLGLGIASRVLLFPLKDLGGHGWLASDSTIQGTGGVKLGNRCPARGINGGLLGVVVTGRRGGVIAGVNSMAARVGAGEKLSSVALIGADGVARGVVLDELVGGRGDSWPVDTDGVGPGPGLSIAISEIGVDEGSAADEAATGGDFM